MQTQVRWRRTCSCGCGCGPRCLRAPADARPASRSERGTLTAQARASTGPVRPGPLAALARRLRHPSRHRPSRSTTTTFTRPPSPHSPRSAPSSSGAAGRPGLCGRTACRERRVRCAGSWLPAARARVVVAGDRGAGGAAEAGHGPQDGVGEGFLGQVAFSNANGFGDAGTCPLCQAGQRGARAVRAGVVVFPVPAPARGARRLPAWKASAAACCSSVGFSTAWLGGWVRVRPRTARRGEGAVPESRCRTARSRRSPPRRHTGPGPAR